MASTPVSLKSDNTVEAFSGLTEENHHPPYPAPTHALSCQLTPYPAPTDALSCQLPPYPANRRPILPTDARSCNPTPYPTNCRPILRRLPPYPSNRRPILPTAAYPVPTDALSSFAGWQGNSYHLSGQCMRTDCKCGWYFFGAWYLHPEP